jgi:hypothetical protein
LGLAMSWENSSVQSIWVGWSTAAMAGSTLGVRVSGYK